MNFKRVNSTLLLFVFFVFYFFVPCLANTNRPSIVSGSAVLIENSTSKVLFEKDMNNKMEPASITKIMTAILTIENCNLNDVVSVPYEAISNIPSGYSIVPLQTDEQITVDQLLRVLMVHSANDAANVLAEHIAGSISSFATMMNTKAAEIGCTGTHFVNPNGIHNKNHYSTAYDLALMGRYAMQNETFRKIVTTTKYTLPATNKFPEPTRFFKATNDLIIPDSRDSVDNYYYFYATGIKTGYTNAAGNCIVASAKKDGVEYIVVILGAERLENGLSARYIDCKNLFNYAFEHYKIYTINQENTVLKQVTISNSSFATKHLNLVVQNDITLLLKKDTDEASINPQIDISVPLEAPIQKNSVVGTISYTIDDNIYSSNLLAGNNVEKSNFTTTFLTFLSIVFVLLFLIWLLKSNNKNNRKKAKKRAAKKKKDKDNYLFWLN